MGASETRCQGGRREVFQAVIPGRQKGGAPGSQFREAGGRCSRQSVQGGRLEVLQAVSPGRQWFSSWVGAWLSLWWVSLHVVMRSTFSAGLACVTPSGGYSGRAELGPEAS